MKFLIDECLHASLVAVAVDDGHDATHVNWIGKSGWQDWNLMPLIVEEAYTFVTENRDDFLRLFAVEAVHNGLVVYMRKSEPPVQRELFRIVLGALGSTGDLFNQVLKVWFEGTQDQADEITFVIEDWSQPA